MELYNVIGVMSGTSLDGTDIAFCTFEEKKTRWNYKIKEAVTINYPDEWKERLSDVEKGSALELAQINSDYGHYLGKLIQRFITSNNLNPDFISSHGHTIFHQPDKRLTLQIGSGAAIAAETNLPVVCDFRSIDVALGGQGAPLVPIGDKFLFSEFKYCLNLGGFANISCDKNEQRIAFDICPVNIVLNILAKEAGKEFDMNGELGRTANIHPGLLERLNSLDYYHKKPPKSLGKEWVLENFLPVLMIDIPLSDKIRTVYEHIGIQIAKWLTEDSSGKFLITGGGAHNSFLIERIKYHIKNLFLIPDKKIIDFKEALVFAFLGILRYRQEVNTLSSVTGAIKNSIGGCIYYNG